MKTGVKIGKKALEFTLPDTELKLRKLNDFVNKKIVLAFYPGAFTSVCKKELCTFRDSISKLNNLNAQVIGISVNDPITNKAFKEQNFLDFPLLSDYNREVIKKYRVILKDFAGLKGYTVAKRSIFIIDTEGIIRYIWISDDPGIEPNYGEIEEELKKISI
jgi:peroxiredoxin